jgi:hypothetical protein
MGMKGRLATIALLAVAVVAAPPPAPVRSQALDLTCQVALTRLDHTTTTNALALETNADYWITGYAPAPGTRLRIEGEFPFSRFMGFNLYDAAARPLEALADREIEPDPGSVNPFRAGGSRFAASRSYTVFVEFGPPPAEPEPNTLYTGDSPGGTFWYRVYMPDHGRDRKGGAPIPRVTLEPAGDTDGPPPLGQLEACGELQAPYLHDVPPLIAEAPAVPVLPTGNPYPGRNPPNWRLFVNFGRGAADIMLDNETGEDFHEAALEPQSDGPGFFSSAHIAYVFAPTSRGHGEMLVLRGRAPSFADTRDGSPRMPRGKQTRYWSLCQYEPATQRVIACRTDDRVKVNRRGNYRIVISTASQRPRNAKRRCGVTWLPWGPATQGLLIYRQLLARKSFRQAIARIPEPGAEREVMRRYYPSGTYLDRESFEARGCNRWR